MRNVIPTSRRSEHHFGDHNVVANIQGSIGVQVHGECCLLLEGKISDELVLVH